MSVMFLVVYRVRLNAMCVVSVINVIDSLSLWNCFLLPSRITFSPCLQFYRADLETDGKDDLIEVKQVMN